MDRAVRQRVLDIFDDWSVLLEERGGLIMLWHAPSEPAGVELRTLGDPPHELCLELQVWLSRRALSESLRDDPDLAATGSGLRDEDDPPWSLPPPSVPWDEEPPPSSSSSS